MATRDTSVSLSIDNGQLVIACLGFAPIIVDPADYPQNLRDHATLMGFADKYRDVAALPVVDGVRPTVAQKHAEIVRLIDHHRTTGEWSRVGTGDGTGTDGLLVRALAESCGIPLDDARATVAGWDKKFQAAMRRDPELAPIIERMRTERAIKTAGPNAPDTRSVLATLRARATA